MVLGRSGMTCLHYACENGHLEVVKELCEALSPSIILQVSRGSGCSGFHYACQNGHLDIVKYFIQYRFRNNIDYSGASGVTQRRRAS